MKSKLPALAVGLLFLVSAMPASAQLTAAKDGPVVYGHHHLNVTSVAEQKKFFVDALGGVPVTIGNREIIKFPNVLVFLREQAPKGGSKGTTADHLGLSFPDLPSVIASSKPAAIGW
jgi:hypothetical protein